MTDTASTPSVEATGGRRRKGRHLSACLDGRRPVEGARSYFSELRLVHHPLPELDWDQLDLRSEFLGHALSRPFFISCMTGGSEAGVRVNRHLVRAAQETGIPVGLGSMRVLLRDPDLLAHFRMKSLAPDVPVWANLSVVQLRDLPPDVLIEWLRRLEVQALVLHCNPGQEQFQPQGDRRFSGVLDAVRRLCDRCPLPVLVKETGFGLRPADVTCLASAGVAAVDIAGAGGTNWVLVEAACHNLGDDDVAHDFHHWGNPTALVLAALTAAPLPILASGGIRNGVDIAKSLALGARLAGLALPFVRADGRGGFDAILEKIEALTRSLRTAMLLTGSRTLADLRQAGLVMSRDFLTQARQYRRNGDWRTWLDSA